MAVSCIYKVNEYDGNFGGGKVGYYERQQIRKETSEFFPGNVAFIDFRVRPIDNGTFWNEYEITTTTGEMVALKRWAEQFDNEQFAKAETIQRAVEKVGQFKSYVECKVANTDAETLIKKFTAKGEAERSEAVDVISNTIKEGRS
jgi:hypothetical protein